MIRDSRLKTFVWSLGTIGNCRGSVNSGFVRLIVARLPSGAYSRYVNRCRTCPTSSAGDVTNRRLAPCRSLKTGNSISIEQNRFAGAMFTRAVVVVAGLRSETPALLATLRIDEMDINQLLLRRSLFENSSRRG